MPEFMKNKEVMKYHKILRRKKTQIFLKRCFDLIFSIILAALMLPFMAVVYFIIKFDSPGKVIFKQKRVTRYGKIFYVYKFRTMVENAEKLGTQVTTDGDNRITKSGKWLRKFRIDEFPQIFNIIKGDLSFVGTRPEVPKYVKHYTPEMMATLLLPAGVTSPASILYKDEAEFLKGSKNPDETYVNEILPQKMTYNLEYIKNFGLIYDIKIMIKTIIAVIKK